MPWSKISTGWSYLILTILLLVIFLYFFYGKILSAIGEFIVHDEKPTPSDVVVVLNSGMEYYPRLIEAARIIQEGHAEKIVINGNRKTEVLRDLEQKGFVRCCPWYENSLRILSVYGVPKEKVIPISVEDAYDTISEAKAVGKVLLAQGYKKIIITTSKFHTFRAHNIWTDMYADDLSICFVSAKTDPYDPNNWWKDGRQIKWVMAEYGAWIYYWWKKIRKE